ncbi:twin-arginine translocase TatA/TatE family subunit [Ornithobacterium rhinotracheale]|uniref:twin-arginine translocase TatA/TatE family subunit n=1 Tax=Ornithobacterium rhinotracheale TaxID=28251 RepID=UPI00129C9D01|nr:twin-arginine translocase TatA/TatE family subunit [Ornithobacterium rhinotracheale]MRI62674.1 twin-arginine translocase TatA/TatE family subunit [Ornithobacterium rhinotracheale]MRJ08130.1 twin-arginine translocase TatA/TatE family subunit [Ornithobacterium rhinotracheale]UOH78364.1 twin-arginine translocase TatA/TatE family subunit [Ornithobacterium rhinotracheale]
MLATVFLGMLGWNEILIIGLIILILFGGRKIPELMKGLGTGIKEFKDATKEENKTKEEKKEEINQQ